MKRKKLRFIMSAFLALIMFVMSLPNDLISRPLQAEMIENSVTLPENMNYTDNEKSAVSSQNMTDESNSEQFPDNNPEPVIPVDTEITNPSQNSHTEEYISEPVPDFDESAMPSRFLTLLSNNPNLLEKDGFVYDPSTETIVAYVGAETNLVIPQTLTIDNMEYLVKHIGDGAFASSTIGYRLTGLSLPEGLLTIGEKAFSLSSIQNLSLPASLKNIGKDAFSFGFLTELILPINSQLEQIAEGAFSTNKLTSLDLSGAVNLQSVGINAFYSNQLTQLQFPISSPTGITLHIGEKAFAQNQLKSIVLPKHTVLVGENAFSNNGRYVFVETESTNVTTQVLKGNFGYIVNPVSFWIKGIEKDTSTVILSPRLLENDPYIEKPVQELLFDGNQLNRPAPRVERYSGERIVLELTSDNVQGYTENSPYEVFYQTTVNPPTISGLNPLFLELNAEFKPLEGVRAEDDLGTDLTDRIVVEPAVIDTSVKGEHNVIYSVTDDAGNITKESRLVSIGLLPAEIEVGNGWVMGDFEFNQGTLLGLSTQGKEKIKTQKELVLPSFNPYLTDRVDITEIAASSFRGQDIVEVVLPEKIEKIGKNTFSNNPLSEITFPETLQVIEDGAFYANKLINVEFPDSVLSIGGSAFANNDMLGVVLSNNLQTMGDAAFENNKLSELQIPKSLTAIPARAFKNNLLSILSLEEGLQSIARSAFEKNYLEDILFPTTLQDIGNSAFRYNYLKNLNLSETSTSLGTYAFANNQIVEYKLPDGLEEVPEGLFQSNQIESLVLPQSVKVIGTHAFRDNNFRKLKLPAHVTDVKSDAFYDNLLLTELVFNEGLENIGDSAFSKNSLSQDELIMPNSLRSIGSYAFSGVYSKMKLGKLVLNEELETIGAHSFQKLYLREVTIPSTLRAIPDYAFYMNQLTNLDLPSSVKTIGSHAFDDNYLADINFPDNGVTIIGGYAFANNRNLGQLNLPESLEEIRRYAFYNNKIGSLIVPENVRSIGEYSFYKNKISSLTLPDNLQTLGSSAFADNELSQVRIPENITVVPSSVFAYNKLEKISLASGTTKISTSAFYKNKLSHVDFPASLTSIDSNAFASNSLTELNLPENLESIGSSAFRDNSLRDLILPPSLQTIGSNSFSKNLLESIDFGSLTAIPASAFQHNRLKNLTLPAQIKSIASKAFANNILADLAFAPDSQIKSLGQEVFANNLLDRVVIPPSLESLSSDSFKNNTGGNLLEGKVDLRIQDDDGNLVNPNNLQSAATYYINSTLMTVRHVIRDNNNDLDIALAQKFVVPIGSTQDVIPLDGLLYTPVNEEPEEVIVPDEPFEKLIFYKENPEFDSQAIELRIFHRRGGGADPQKPLGLKEYTVTYGMNLILTLEVGGDTTSVPDAWMVLDLNDPVVGGHISDVGWPSNIAGLVEDYKFENGQIKVKLKGGVQKGQAIDLPITIYFEGNNTPHGFVLDLSGKLQVVSDGQIIKTSDPDKRIGLRARTYQQSVQKRIEGNTSSFYEYRSEIDDENCLLPDAERPIKFSYKISSDSSYNKKYYRNMNRLIIEDLVPTYSGKNDLGEVVNNLKAVFVPELSPGWKLSEDKSKVVLDINFPNALDTDGGIPEFPLYFRFPGMQVSSSCTKNTMNFTLYPANTSGVIPGNLNEAEAIFNKSPVAYEEDKVLDKSDSNCYYLRSRNDNPVDPTPPTFNWEGSVRAYKRNTAFFGDSSSSTKYNQTPEARRFKYNYRGNTIDWYTPEQGISQNGKSHYANAFPDLPKYREREFTWGMNLTFKNTEMQDIQIDDYNLDSRMYYTGVEIPQEMKSATLKIYSKDNQQGTILLEEKIYSERYEIPEDIGKKAGSLSIVFDDSLLVKFQTSKTLQMAVYTRLRNPEVNLFNSVGTDYYGRSTKNRLYNRLKVSAKALNIKEDQVEVTTITSIDPTEYIHVLPVESNYGLLKSLYDGENLVTDSKVNRNPNEDLTYLLRLKSSQPAGRAIEDFLLVDLLPEYVLPEAFEPSVDFLANSKNYRSDIIEDYEGTGRYAIVIRADSFVPSFKDFTEQITNIGKVKARTSLEIESGQKYTNEAMLSGKGDPFWNLSSTKPQYNDFADYTKVLRANASFPTLLGASLDMYKFVKSDDDLTWAKRFTYVQSEEAFQYRISLSNSTNLAMEEIDLIDVLPYNNDLRITPNENDERVPRGTLLENQLPGQPVVAGRAAMTGPVSFGEAGDEQLFEAFYATATDEQLKTMSVHELMNNLTWLSDEQVTDWSNIRVVRLSTRENQKLSGKSLKHIYIPMKAPQNDDYFFDDQQAVNSSVVRNGGDSSTFVEANNAAVIMRSQRGTLKIHKVGYNLINAEKSDLADVKFRLWKVYKENIDGDVETKILGQNKVLLDPVEVDIDGQDQTVLTTSNLGIAIFDGLRLNRDYLLEEISAPDNYQIRDKYTLISGQEMNNVDQNYTLEKEIVNDEIVTLQPMEPMKGKVTLRKVNAKNQPLPFTRFVLEGGPDKDDPEYGQYHVYLEGVTSETGLLTFEDLPVFGSDFPPYVLKEVQARGILQAIADRTIKFSGSDLEKNINLGTIVNDKAILSVYKLGIFNLTEQNKSLERLTRSSGRRLDGVKIQLQDLDGKVLKEELTDARGEVKFKDLDVNIDYYLYEPEVPENYRPYENSATKNRIKVRIDEMGRIRINDILSYNRYVVYPNYIDQDSNILDLQKIDPNGKILPGAVFALYELIYDENGDVLERKLVEEATTDKQGKITFSNFGMQEGQVNPQSREADFEVVEVSPPLGYQAGFEPVRIHTVEDQFIYESLEALNYPISLSITKHEEGKPEHPVVGAEFSLYEGDKAEGEPLEIVASDHNGQVNFKYDAFDINKKYSVKETKIPKDYEEIIPGEIRVIDLPGLSAQHNFRGEIHYEWENRLSKAYLIINKLDQSSLQALQGVKFQLADQSESDKEDLREAVSNAKGLVRFDGLTPGKTYSLTEVATLDGYELLEEAREIEVTEAERIDLTLTNRQKPTSLEIRKQDELGHLLQGVEFTLQRRVAGFFYWDVETKISDENGQVIFTNLDVGKHYRIFESSVENASPSTDHGAWNGYQKSPDVYEVDVQAPHNPADDPVIIVKDENDGEVESNPLVFVNQRVEPEKVKVEVLKHFSGGYLLENSPEFEIVLQRQAGTQAWEEIDRTTINLADLDAQQNLTVAFKDLEYDYLDQADNSYKAYRYRVIEEINGEMAECFKYTVTPDNANDNNRYLQKFTVDNEYASLLTEVKATKTWDNGGESIPEVYFKLYRSVADSDSVAVPGAELKSVSENQQVEVIWQDMPINDNAGNPYMYSVHEVNAEGEDFVPAGYQQSGVGLNLINTKVINLPVQKIWEDEDDKDGIRPQSIQINLLVDGVKTGKSVELNANNNWRASFDDLLKYQKDTEIRYIYTVEEEKINGYELTENIFDENNGFKLINKHEPENKSTIPTTGERMLPVALSIILLAGGLALISLKRKKILKDRLDKANKDRKR